MSELAIENAHVEPQAPVMTTLGERILLARRRAGLDAMVLADRVGMSRKLMRRLESDESIPNVRHLTAIASLTGVSRSWLMDGDGAATTTWSVRLVEAAGHPTRDDDPKPPRVVSPIRRPITPTPERRSIADPEPMRKAA